MVALCIALVILIVLFAALHQSTANNYSSVTGGSVQKGGVNNPGYLITSNVDWKGKQQPNSGFRFENFDTMRNGVRAWYINLFNKIKKGVITNTNNMIDVLTPAGSDNPENARINYKQKVALAKNWYQLGYYVFNFENNESWRVLSDSDKNFVIQQGLSDAVLYCYNGNTPNYFI